MCDQPAGPSRQPLSFIQPETLGPTGPPGSLSQKEVHMETSVRTILITNTNLSSLRQLFDSVRRFLPRKFHHLQLLEEALTRAQVVKRDQIPGDVITINTRVRIHELDVGRQSVYTLVFPGEADVARNRISVLAPMGSALLGHRVGDLIECAAPGVTKRLKVKEIVYQPEAVQPAA